MEEFDGSRPTLLIIDDLMDQVDQSVANLFTKGSHHRNVSVVFLVQNLFHKNKHISTISFPSPPFPPRERGGGRRGDYK